MKTKTFFMLCLFLGIGLTQLSAQPAAPPNGTGTIKFTVEINPYTSPAYCNGELADEITGSGTTYALVHYKDGNKVWFNYHYIGTATSDYTGEVFQVKENDYKQYQSETIWAFHVNFIGNQGSHYIGAWTVDWGNGTVTIDKAVCPGNNK